MNQFLSRIAFALLLASPFLILAPVYAEASTITTIPGCTATTAYSPITGAKCPVTVVPGCTMTTAFSPVTGQRCPGVPIPGCTLTTAYSPITGAKCDTISPVSSDISTVPSVTASTTGTSTLKVLPVALLAGGTAQPGTTQPISYLQIINEGYASSTINGFWVKEDGNAPEAAVIGFSSVDDKGMNRQSVGGTEGKSMFVNGLAYVPSGAVIGPRQMKLFTIKAQLSANAGQYAGTDLMLDVAGVDAQASYLNTFPVRGTTWVITR